MTRRMRSSLRSVVTPTRAASRVGYRAHAGASSEAEPRLIVVISLNICCRILLTVSLLFEDPRCLELHTQAGDLRRGPRASSGRSRDEGGCPTVDAAKARTRTFDPQRFLSRRLDPGPQEQNDRR